MSKAILDGMMDEMTKSIQSLQKDLTKVRTGRASAALVDSIHVEYYGTNTPLNQVSNITTPDARTVQIVPWEQSIIGAIEKAILAANIGYTPQNDGRVIRVPIPALTEERRKEMVKMIKKIGEESKIAIRTHRRDANEEVKKAEKNKALSKDDAQKLLDQIQEKTDAKVQEIDKIIALKEKEIMTV